MHQPWAWAIATGRKPLENRGWDTHHRGTLAIHAGRAWDRAALGLIAGRCNLPATWWAAPDRLLGRGVVIALVDLVQVCPVATAATRHGRECGCGPWAVPGQYHWRLANVRALAEPVPCRGMQGLWTVPADVEALVLEHAA